MQKINNSPEQVYEIFQSDFGLLEFFPDEVYVPLAWRSLSSISCYYTVPH